MPALEDCHQAIEEAPKVASVYQKAITSQTPKRVSTPQKKKAPVGCILNSMTPSNGVRGGEERGHKSLVKYSPMAAVPGRRLSGTVPG